jgi:magnesium transporter
MGVQREISHMKRRVIALRRFIAPQRDIINMILVDHPGFISQETKTYFRDIHDHLLHILDTIEVHRDLLSGAMESYMSQISNQLNEIMKVLSIVATVILPLTLLSGIYGMNFDAMPGIHHRLGFWFVVGFMFLVGFLLVAFFRRRRWL